MKSVRPRYFALFILIALMVSILPNNTVSASSTNELPWPLDTRYGITTGFYYSDGSLHNGVDMAAPSGTPIYANFSGTAEYYQLYTTISGTNYLTSFGNCVYLTSTDGKYYAIFGHMNAFNGFSLTIPSSRTRQKKEAPDRLKSVLNMYQRERFSDTSVQRVILPEITCITD